MCQIYIFSVESQTVTQNHLTGGNSKNFISKNINMSRYTPHILYNRTITSWYKPTALIYASSKNFIFLQPIFLSSTFMLFSHQCLGLFL